MNFEVSARLAETRFTVAFQGGLAADGAAQAVADVAPLSALSPCVILGPAALDLSTARDEGSRPDLARGHPLEITAAVSGADLRLVIPAPAVLRILQVLGIDSMLRIYPSLRAALTPAPPPEQ